MNLTPYRRIVREFLQLINRDTPQASRIREACLAYLTANQEAYLRMWAAGQTPEGISIIKGVHITTAIHTLNRAVSLILTAIEINAPVIHSEILIAEDEI